jgi:hypothetical protein
MQNRPILSQEVALTTGESAPSSSSVLAFLRVPVVLRSALQPYFFSQIINQADQAGLFSAALCALSDLCGGFWFSDHPMCSLHRGAPK